MTLGSLNVIQTSTFEPYSLHRLKVLDICCTREHVRLTDTAEVATSGYMRARSASDWASGACGSSQGARL